MKDALIAYYIFCYFSLDIHNILCFRINLSETFTGKLLRLTFPAGGEYFGKAGTKK